MVERPAVIGVLNRVIAVLVIAGVWIHAVMVCAQPFLAGWSLDGDGTALDLHRINGSLIVTMSMLLIPLTVLWWRPGRRSIAVPLLVVLLFFVESFQLALGFGDHLALHVPLGVTIVVASLWLCLLVRRRPPDPNRPDKVHPR